ncbi:bifunctional Protein kinase [Babesia duncani]|uniref:Cyclin-dependent kinase 2 homolog n=1 Tax=Babesia duncani TaxID=323732 RepID=A0AAD9UNE3_9APIC|nr:bifunctional Protein kinase [Babesia duncani]
MFQLRSTGLVSKRAIKTKKNPQIPRTIVGSASDANVEILVSCDYERPLVSCGFFQKDRVPKNMRIETIETAEPTTTDESTPTVIDDKFKDIDIEQNETSNKQQAPNDRINKKPARRDVLNEIYIDITTIRNKLITEALINAELENGIVTFVEKEEIEIIENNDIDIIKTGNNDDVNVDQFIDDHNNRSVTTDDIVSFNNSQRCQNLRSLAIKLFMNSKSNHALDSILKKKDSDSGSLDTTNIYKENEVLFKAQDTNDESHVKSAYNGTALNCDFSFLKRKRFCNNVNNNIKASRNTSSVVDSTSQRYVRDKYVTSTPKNSIHVVNQTLSEFSNINNRVSLPPRNGSVSIRNNNDKRANVRRGLLSHNIQSSESVKRYMQSSYKGGIYNKQNNLIRDSSWELWGNYFNVLIENVEVLGNGSFATVYKAKLRPIIALKQHNDPEVNCQWEIVDKNCKDCKDVRLLDCAVKSIVETNSNAVSQYTREREMMLHFNCNVLKPYGYRRIFDAKGTINQLLMPMAQGDLLTMVSNLVHERSKGALEINNKTKLIGLTEQEVKFIFYQILSGVAFIQMCFQGDIHRHSDLKLANIVVFCSKADVFNPFKWRICLADFGSAILLHPTLQLEGASHCNMQSSVSKKWLQTVEGQLTSFYRGTVRYNAPEALPFDKKGSRRFEHNPCLLSAYQRMNPAFLRPPVFLEDEPQVWGSVFKPCESMNYQNVPCVVTLPSDATSDAEYYIMGMTTDMWSCGILLAELCKFGTNEGVPQHKSQSKGIKSMITHALNMTLGRGLFCRSVGLQNKNQQIKSDEELNHMLSTDIAECCNVKRDIRFENIKNMFYKFEKPTFSKDFFDLLTDLLAYEPHERPIAAEALGHKWFNDLDFDALDQLGPCTGHLPMEHFYCLSTSYGSISRDVSPLSAFGSSNPFEYDNSDFSIETFANFAKLCQRNHAWYTGPLHYRFHKLQKELDVPVRLNCYVLRVCNREAVVLESREKQVFGYRGYILSALLKIKQEHQLTWPEETLGNL